MRYSDSRTSFDAGHFSAGAGALLASGIASVVISARQQAQARADARATDDALASWQDLVAGLEAQVAALRETNAHLVRAVTHLEDENLLLSAENASLAQRLSDIGR